MDDVMTLRGRIAPRARDVAFIASIPEVGRKIVEYRLKYYALKLGNLGLMGMRTWGAFSVGNGGEWAYAAGRAGGIVDSIYWRREQLKFYDEVYDLVFNAYFQIPPEIRNKIDEHMIQGGVPENKVGPYFLTNVVHGIRGGILTADLVADLATPAIQVLVSGERLPIEWRFGALALAYLGLAVGPALADNLQRANFEWHVVRSTAKAARENGGFGEVSRLQVVQGWARSNMQRFIHHYLVEGILTRMGDVISAAAVMSRRSDLFGLVNMAEGIAGGFVGILGTLNGLKGARVESAAFEMARHFCDEDVYLPNETVWDKFARERGSIENCELEPDEICRLVDFRSIGSNKDSTSVNGSLRSGKVTLVEGGSGDGKTLFLYAMRGLARSEGEVFFRTNLGCRSIYNMSQKELKRRIAYYSPDEYSGKGLRLVDVYTDIFLDKNPKVLDDVYLARAMSVEDVLLERQIERMTKKVSGTLENPWEEGLFNGVDLGRLEEWRLKRKEFVAECVRKLGRNMEGIDPQTSLAKLSSGMRERVLLDRVLGALKSGGVEIIVLDEAWGRVDPDTARQLVVEICKRLLELPVELRPAMVWVSNVHKKEIREEITRMLGGGAIVDINVGKIGNSRTPIGDC